jgi:AraC-like DNA-binding protein
MRILALLPGASCRVLEHALVGGQLVAREPSAAATAATVAAVQNRECDVLVVDPGALSDELFQSLLPVLSHGRVPVLLFASLTPASARRVVRAAEVGVHELVVRGAEDAPQVIARKLASLYHPSAPAHLLNRAAPRFRRFPERLQVASVSLFGSGALPRWVNELAAASGCARRSVDRWMERVGIEGASTLLDTARLARVWEPLVEQRLAVAAVSALCGYERPRLFVAHTRRLVGAVPSEMAESMSRREFSERLAKVLLGS